MSENASNDRVNRDISRRGFFKGTAALIGVSVIADSDLKAAETQTPVAAESDHVPGYIGEGDWLGTPPVIPDSQITKTIDVDVLVLGGGHAGLLAALGASDKGAKVAVIERKDEAGFLTDYWHRIGEDIANVNSKWLLKRGYGPYDTGEITQEFVKRALGRCNPDVIRLFVENSGAMFDRMVEVYESYEAQRKADDSAVKFKYSDGVTETYDFSNLMDNKYLFNQIQKDRSPKDYPIECGGYKTWPCVAQFQGPVLRRSVAPFVSVLRWFEKYTVRKTQDNGATWYYEHKGVVLIQEAGGPVTGAIVQDKDGKYLRFNARKAVVVTTGDFSGNKDMVWSLMNETIERMERHGTTRSKYKAPGTVYRDGSGHKMCCWAGGLIENNPRAYMNLAAAGAGPWGVSPMLLLNANAKRFADEASVPLLGSVVLRQPKGLLSLVTDKNYMKSVVIAGLEHGGPNFGRPEWFLDMEEDMGKVLAAGAKGYAVRGLTVAERNPGTVFGANTLEELAGYLGYTGDLIQTFVESIKRYNELCHKGVDSDFGKEAKAMIPIEKAPFYGCASKTNGGESVGSPTLTGMITDEKLRVLDKSGKPIKGLFVAGNTLGGRYGLNYCTPMAGNTIGMAMTHGWMAGKFATES